MKRDYKYTKTNDKFAFQRVSKILESYNTGAI